MGSQNLSTKSIGGQKPQKLPWHKRVFSSYVLPFLFRAAFETSAETADGLDVRVEGPDSKILAGEFPLIELQANSLTYRNYAIGRISLQVYNLNVNLSGLLFRSEPLYLLTPATAAFAVSFNDSQISRNISGPEVNRAISDIVCQLVEGGLSIRNTVKTLDPLNVREKGLFGAFNIQNILQTVSDITSDPLIQVDPARDILGTENLEVSVLENDRLALSGLVLLASGTSLPFNVRVCIATSAKAAGAASSQIVFDDARLQFSREFSASNETTPVPSVTLHLSPQVAITSIEADGTSLTFRGRISLPANAP